LLMLIATFLLRYFATHNTFYFISFPFPFI